MSADSLETERRNTMISVIIPFRDNVNQVKECVQSILTQPYKSVEIVLVSDRINEHISGIRTLHTPKLKGVGQKRNAGVKASKGEILFFLDSDCTVMKDTFTELVGMFEEIDTDAISGKPLAPKKGNLIGIATGLEYEDRFDRMGENYVEIAATTCLAMKRDAFESIGGFKDYSTGEATGEDWDFSIKFTKAGFKIFHTNRVRVYHNHVNDSIKKWFSRRIEHSAYRVTHRKRHGQLFEEYFSLRMFIVTTALLCIPVAIRMYKKTGRVQAFAMPIFAVLRNIAWFAGVVKELVYH